MTKMRRYFGHVMASAKHKKYRYKALGHADIEHAYFALYSSAVLFYSTDTSFEDLRNDSDFGSMGFEIIPHPSRAGM